MEASFDSSAPVGAAKPLAGAAVQREMKYILAYPPVDFRVPFNELRPEQIDLYFHYSNEIGKETCRARCEHCYFENRPRFDVEPELALAITASLRRQGYNIGMVPADSFAEKALAVGAAGSAFRLPAMGSSAWSSGATIVGDGWRDRLGKAWELGFRSIIITAHDVANTGVPFSGVTRNEVINEAFKNISAWNSENPDKSFLKLCTFTINRKNCNLESMRLMANWALQAGIDTARFNCFANFRADPALVDYEMSKADIVKFFGLLAELQREYYNSSLRFGISEDWGDAGIEQIYDYLPLEWRERSSGWCRAGYRLFAMVQEGDKIVITGCVDKWEPNMGYIEKCGEEYRIVWDVGRIENLRNTILEERAYACWGGVGCERDEDAGFGPGFAAGGDFWTRDTALGHDATFPV